MVNGSTESSNAADAAFEEVYRRTYPQMMALAVATTRNRSLAEDAVHDAYVSLWRDWRSIQNPIAWMRRAVVSNCLDVLRTASRRNAILRRQPPPGDVFNDEPEEYLQMLAGLNERQRVAVVLRYVYDLSEAEVAQVLDCRPGTVKSTLSRALKILRGTPKRDAS